MQPNTFPLSQLSQLVGGTLLDAAHGQVVIRQIASIEGATADSITFVETGQLVGQALASPCAAVIVPQSVTAVARPAIAVKNPRLAFARLLQLFHPPSDSPPGLSSAASVDATARVHPTASVGPYAVVERHAVIGAGTQIGALCRVGVGSVLGAGCRVYPGVRIGARVEIGSAVILHSGCCLGTASGAEAGSSFRVILGDDVEIGARTYLEAGSEEATIVGSGTKCDNMVFVGSGARVGRACILVSQTCVEAGSVLEDGCVVAAQGMVRQGQRLGAQSIVAARSLPARNVPPGAVVSGIPARPHREELRHSAALHKMGELFGRLLALEEAAERLR